MSRDKLMEKAEQSSDLKPVAGKSGLFVIESISTDVEGCFLDLRNDKCRTYKYDGEDGEQIPYSDLPEKVKEIKKLKKAEGNKSIGDFA